MKERLFEMSSHALNPSSFQIAPKPFLAGLRITDAPSEVGSCGGVMF
jgi:hypothetical protein